MTSAESRLAAASNEMRVRVESSKKRLTTVRPRRAGSFLIGRSASERISSAVARTSSASSRVRSPALSRCCFIGRSGSALDDHGVLVVDAGEVDPHPLDQRGREVLADEVGADRQLAVAAVDQDREPDRPRPADVVQRVERGADGAAGEQHVVDQHDDLAVDAAVAGSGSGSSVRAGLQPQVVAVHRHVERADRARRRPRRRRSARRSAGRAGRRGDGMPSRTRSAAPLLRSRISWEMRVRAREMSRASSTVRPVPADRAAVTAGGWQAQASACRTSFSASRDGSLKDVDRGRP